ncbi:beta-ketoacyl-[acyl-carrier-protein] synthase family protein [Aliikangiella maris]|uniref:Beta-ketoacyl-[acyl-carrier-protein] synthase family protein n=2 Tax=Aliikangiella maris TaxID=3162458 RepID=A0ABV2BTX5_9GAMM
MKKVFITGLGVIFPGGENVEQLWQKLLGEPYDPVKGFAEFSDRINNRYIFSCSDTLPEFAQPQTTSDSLNQKAVGRSHQLALGAVYQAIKDAALQPTDLRLAGLSVGTTMGDESALEDSRETQAAAQQKIDTSEMDHTEANALLQFPFELSAMIAEQFKLFGPNLTISNACTSGLYGIDLAAEKIRTGEADIMLAGGVESSSRIVLSCFNRLGALDEGQCRPFDEARNGTVLGEGAAFVVLESAESVERRQATTYGEYKASGWSCDAHQPTAPEPSGVQIERALLQALNDSGLRADDIDCILPHGTGTPLNDALEAQVLNKIFASNENKPAVTAIKSRLGHSGGASGAFSVLVACLMLKHQLVPTTAHLKNLTDGFALPIPTQQPLQRDINQVLVNAYAFGGNNISVVVGR